MNNRVPLLDALGIHVIVQHYRLESDWLRATLSFADRKMPVQGKLELAFFVV